MSDIALYCIADDFIKALANTEEGRKMLASWNPKRGPQRQLSLSEVLTLNILPPRMRRYLMSETHFRPGSSARKSRFSTFSHAPRPCPESVVRGRHHPRRAFSPFSHIRRAARFRLTHCPCSSRWSLPDYVNIVKRPYPIQTRPARQSQ